MVRLLALAGAHLGLSSGELGLLFTSAAGQVLCFLCIHKTSVLSLVFAFWIIFITGERAGVEGSFGRRG